MFKVYNTEQALSIPLNTTEVRFECYIDFKNQDIVFPDSVKIIRCGNCNLTDLPKYLPFGLLSLYCHDNKITEVPPLPEKLQVLDCENNRINKLPDILPSTLERLYLAGNQLTKPPNVFSTKVIILSLTYNKLTYTPRIPASACCVYIFKNYLPSYLCNLTSTETVSYLKAKESYSNIILNIMLNPTSRYKMPRDVLKLIWDEMKGSLKDSPLYVLGLKD